MIVVLLHLGGSGSRGLAGAPASKAEAPPACADDGRPISQPIEERRREFLVPGEDLRPLAEGEVARDEHGAPLVACGEEIEEEFAARTIERDEAELVEDEQLDALEPTLQPGQLARVARVDECAHEIGRTP